MSANLRLFFSVVFLFSSVSWGTSNPYRFPYAAEEPSSSENPQTSVFKEKLDADDVPHSTFDFSRHTPPNTALRSALVPGWGQRFNGQKIKGTALFLGFALALGGSFNLYRKSRNSFDEYERRGVRDGPEYDDYEKELLQAIFLGGVAVFIWGFSIRDAYKNAYKPLWSKKVPVQLAAGKDSIDIKWKKRF